MLACAIGLLLLGGTALFMSRSVTQLRIQYDGETSDGPYGTKSEEIAYQPCIAVAGNTTSCKVSLTVVENMEPPILAYYVVDPFYQNYNVYLLRGRLNDELEGQEGVDRTTCRDTAALTGPSGKELVPCGLQAKYMFNDTFELEGIMFDTSDIAWPTDVDWFENPPDHLSRPNTSWLHDRYPGIVEEEEGVRNPHFVTWMRPEATSYAQKLYGRLDQALEKGQSLSLSINANFIATSLGARKELVLTTYNSLGGRNDALGIFLLVWGGICLVSAFAGIAVVCVCPRATGKGRSCTRNLGEWTL